MAPSTSSHASKGKGVEEDHQLPSEIEDSGLGDFLAKIAMLETLRNKIKEDLDSNSKDPGFGDLLLQIARLVTLRDKLKEDLASNSKDSGLGDLLSRKAMLETLHKKFEEPDLARLHDKLPKDPDSFDEGSEEDHQLPSEIENSDSAKFLENGSDFDAMVRKFMQKLHEIKMEAIAERYRDPENQYSRYLPLYKATLDGDWESAKRYFDGKQTVITAPINHNSCTTLNIAIHGGKSHIGFIENLITMMSREELMVKNKNGITPLGMAAIVGNTTAAKMLVKKNPDLLYISDNKKYLPVHHAAYYAHKETLVYLQRVTRGTIEPNPYTGESGFQHLLNVIVSEFYDIALELVSSYPELATIDMIGFDTPLMVMAKKVSAFPSGSDFNIWERLVYYGLQVNVKDYHYETRNGDMEELTRNPQVPNGDVENPTRNHQLKLRVLIGFSQLRFLSTKFIDILAPAYIKEKKVMHHQALQLVRFLCNAIKSSNDYATCVRCTLEPIVEAATLGIPEVIEEIVNTLPFALWTSTCQHHNILQLAVINRCEKVFNLIYQMDDHRQYLLTRRDDESNNILHLAAKLAPPHKLKLVSGAALQMQRELQWYKEVEKYMKPADKQRLNSSKKTPAMVFSEEHKDLVVAGEKWMKDTATSCSIATALIVTVVFAGAITIPGGINNSSGLPIFINRFSFQLFFISDAISLFTSTTSLLMFLSILTARYTEQDFLFALPNRLVIGLVTLFISTTTMMMAFGATFYLVFAQGKVWPTIPIIALGCLPVTTFVTLQFPLLVDVITSTYGHRIFGKQSDRQFY